VNANSPEVFARLVAAQNAHDIEALVACFAADYLSEQPTHPDRAFRGNAQVRKNWSSIFAGVPDFHAELLDAAVEGETAWGEFEWRGRRRDGSAFHSRGVIIGKTRDGKLVAARLYMSDVDEAGRGIDAAVEGMAGKR